MAGMTRILELDNRKSDEGKLTVAGIWQREFEGVEGAPEKRTFQDWNTTGVKFARLARGGTSSMHVPKIYTDLKLHVQALSISWC